MNSEHIKSIIALARRNDIAPEEKERQIANKIYLEDYGQGLQDGISEGMRKAYAEMPRPKSFAMRIPFKKFIHNTFAPSLS